MKRLIPFAIIAVLAIIMAAGALAQNWNGVVLAPPGGLAAVSYDGQYSKTFVLDEVTGIPFQSCHIAANYQLGSCDYLYKCYIILPQSCTQTSCAKGYSCTEILAPSSSDTQI